MVLRHMTIIFLITAIFLEEKLFISWEEIKTYIECSFAYKSGECYAWVKQKKTLPRIID